MRVVNRSLPITSRYTSMASGATPASCTIVSPTRRISWSASSSCCRQLLARRLRNLPCHERLGGIDEDARRRTRGIPDEPSAGRIRRVARDGRCGERPAVRQCCMAVDSRQEHRVPWRRGIERTGCGPVGDRPPVLVPPAPQDPVTFAHLRSTRTHLLDDRLEGRCISQVELLQRGAKAEDVSVRVLQARHNRLVPGIDDLRGRPAPPQHIGRRAHRDESRAPDSEPLGGRLRFGHRVDDRVVHDQIRRRPGARAAGRAIAAQAASRVTGTERMPGQSQRFTRRSAPVGSHTAAAPDGRPAGSGRRASLLLRRSGGPAWLPSRARTGWS